MKERIPLAALLSFVFKTKPNIHVHEGVKSANAKPQERLSKLSHVKKYVRKIGKYTHIHIPAHTYMYAYIKG